MTRSELHDGVTAAKERASIVDYIRELATQSGAMGSREADPRISRVHHLRASQLRQLASNISMGVHLTKDKDES